MKPVFLAAVVIAGVVAFAAPAGAKAKAPSPESTTDLAEVVAARGLGCDDFVNNGDTVPAPGFPEAEEGECTIQSRTASVSVMANAADRVEAVGSMPMLCPFIRMLGPTLTIVYAKNWMISMAASDVPKAQLAKPLGAKQTEIDCSGNTK